VFLSLGGRSLLENAAGVHSTAEGELAQARKWFDGRGVVVPPIMDLEPYRSLPGPERARATYPFLGAGTRPVVLFLSRLHPKKSPESLLKSAAELRDGGVDATFVLAGPGDETYVRALKERTAELRLDDRVHFVGMVGGADKLSLYQAADLFVLPTQQENFGVVFIEALACGLPVVTTQGVDIWPELKASGAASIIEDAGSQLTPELMRLLPNPGERRSMASKARPWAMEHFDESRTTRQFEKLYEDARSVAARP
jgi:glycosyltransferase involved in cell wall biosynthesis